ncbi:hypothetical protein [Tropicibacter sp. S64]|uniref:hypothetical protein n=1 Tax=Tropicibacter sp. S64 TaxID=3415122 RepID=UPI003C7AD185
MSSYPDPDTPHRSGPPAFVWAILVLLLFVMALPVVDFLMFSVAGRKFGKPTSALAYVEYRLGIDIPGAGTEPEPEAEQVAFSDAPLGAMTIEEKRAFAKRLDDVLPPSHDGWVRRAYVKEDYYRLNPDLARCKQHAIPSCPRGTGSKHTVVYEKGKKLIAVRLRFQRDRDFSKPGVYIPPGKISPRSGQGDFILHMFSGAGNGSYWDYKYYDPFMRRGQFNFVQKERQKADTTGILINYPYRLFMRQRHDGVFDAFVVSNAEAYEIKRFLQNWDYQTIAALIAPVASGFRSGSEIEAEKAGRAYESTWTRPMEASDRSGGEHCNWYSREKEQELQRLLSDQRKVGDAGGKPGRVVQRNCKYVVVRD